MSVQGKKDKIFYGWFIVGASFITLFVATGIGFFTFSVFMLPLEKFFGASRTSITGFNSVMALIAGFATPVVGILVHSWGPRKVLGFGAVLTGIAYVLLSRSTQVWHLYALSVFLGTGLSAITLIPNQTIIAHWFVKKRGTAMGVTMMGLAVGGIVWAPLAHDLIKRFDWQTTYVIFGIVIPAIVVPLAIFVIRRSPESMGLLPDGEVGNPESGPSSPAAGPADNANLPNLTVPQTIRTASFWYLFFVNFFMVFGTSIVTAHTVGIVTSSPFGVAKGVETAMRIGSRVIMYFLIVSIAGRFLGGYLAERFSKRVVMFAHYIAMIIAALALFKLETAAVLSAFIFLYGMGSGGSAVIYPLLIAENFGLLSFSKILGIMGIPFTLGAAIGQASGAEIYDTTKSYAGVFALLMFVFAMGAVLVLLAKPPKVAAGAASSTSG